MSGASPTRMIAAGRTRFAPAWRAAAITACALAMLASAPGVSRAGGDACGTTGAGFLGVGTGASVLGRGGATLGLAGGLASVPWNAAALGWLSEGEVSIAHATLADQARQDWVGVGDRLFGSPVRWAVLGLGQSEGSFEGRDASGSATGSFDVSSMAFAANLAARVGPCVTIGAAGKCVSERLGPVRGLGFTSDLGVQARAGLLGFGLSATNLGGSMSYSGSRYPMPTNFGLGASLELPLTGLSLAADLDLPRAYYRDVRVGAEWRCRDLVTLRAGYRRELNAPSDLAGSGPSFGAGAHVHGVWLDYAYLIPRGEDGQHRLALTLRPGRLFR